jgi:3-phenylpropionate/trans-cinnamate dioxygenase ferredoxin reductase component
MTNYDYLIIGGGMTGGAGVDGIREVDPIGGVGMISTERDAPYNRPPLSKALWRGKPLNSIWRKKENKRVKMRESTSPTASYPNASRSLAHSHRRISKSCCRCGAKRSSMYG